MQKALIILFLMIAESSFATTRTCDLLFSIRDTNDIYNEMNGLKTMGINLNRILDIKHIENEGDIKWYVLHVTKVGYYLTKVNAALEAKSGYSLELSKREFRSITKLPMADRLLKAGLTPISEKSGIYKMSETLNGESHEFLFYVSGNVILDIYKKQ